MGLQELGAGRSDLFHVSAGNMRVRPGRRFESPKEYAETKKQGPEGRLGIVRPFLIALVFVVGASVRIKIGGEGISMDPR